MRRRGSRRGAGAAAAVAAVLAAAAGLPGAAPLRADTHLLVVAGVGGEETYTERFHLWSTRVVDAALAAGLSPENVVYLGEREEIDPERIGARSTGENVLAEIAALAERSSAGDDVWIVLFGHGSGAAGPPRFNLPGRDLVAEEYAAALERLADRRVVFVNASSASGGFIGPLSAEGRVVITATKSGGQSNEALFGGYLAEAFDGAAGDADKDGRTSALEAFEFAQREIERYYRETGLLRTENALLDDDGDGLGSPAPAGVEASEASDGRLASLLYLGQEAEPSTLTAEARELTERRDGVRRRIDELRLQRDALDEDVYLSELQELMVELALVERELEESAGDVDADADADAGEEPDVGEEPDA